MAACFPPEERCFRGGKVRAVTDKIDRDKTERGRVHMMMAFTANILIPAYTLLFVKGSNWFNMNFSVLGNLAGRGAAFALWGLLIGWYFFVCFRKIFRLLPEKYAGSWMVPAALVLLVFAVTTPYLPDQFPLKAFLHILFAFTAAVCLMICLLRISWKLYRREPDVYGRYLTGIAGIAVGCVVLFILSSGIISTALELFFTVSTSMMAFRLYRRMRESFCREKAL